ncbi:MAG: cytidylyltransferase domain-containing protein [Gemmatimonadales bacterium]
MRVVAVIQARMGSTRLPGKVLMDIAGAPMLGRVVDRARAARRVTEVRVACSDQGADDPIAAWCAAAGVAVTRGPEADVLARYRIAATEAAAEVVVRLTADCPLLDPATIDKVIAALGDGGSADYAANVLDRSFPRGLDVEAFSIEALLRMDRLGRSAAAREHVTLGPRLEHPAAFRTRNVRAAQDDSDLRWTVDTGPDLEQIRTMYRELDLAGTIRPYLDVVRWCRDHPTLASDDRGNLTWDPMRRTDLIGGGR